MQRRIGTITVLAFFSLACAATPSETGDLGDATNTSSDDTNVTEGSHGPDIFGPCECYDDLDECGAEALASAVSGCEDGPTCVIEGLCPGMSPDNCGEMGECNTELEYSGDIDCALAALRDRTPATIILREQQFLGAAACGTVYGDTHTIWHVPSMKRIPKVSCTESDSGGTFWDFTRSRLADATYFDDCADLVDDSERHACVIAGLIEPEELSNCAHQGG